MYLSIPNFAKRFLKETGNEFIEIWRGLNAVPSKEVSQRAFEYYASPWEVGREALSPANQESLLKAYKTWVYVAASKNAATFATIPLRLYISKKNKNQKFQYSFTKQVPLRTKEYLYKNKSLQPYLSRGVDVEEVTVHPFLSLMQNINNFTNQFEFFELTSLHPDLCGNCYWYVVSNRLGVPSELWIVPPQNMEIVTNKKKFISGYVYNYGMEKIPFKETEIIHFKHPNPNNSYYGYSPLVAVADAYNINAYMNIYEKAMFENSAKPEGVLESDFEIGADERERVGADWNAGYRGASKTGKTAILDMGLKFKQISFTPKDLAFLQGRKLTKEEIINAYGQSMALFDKDSTRANADVANYMFRRDAIKPRLLRTEQKINEKLIPRYGQEGLFCSFDNPVPQDEEFNIRLRESNLKWGVSNVNMERELMGLEPVSWGEMPIMPLNVAPLGTSAKDEEQEREVIE